MSKTIPPTAEMFYHNHNLSISNMDGNPDHEAVFILMQDYAKLHVKASLEAAAENAKLITVEDTVQGQKHYYARIDRDAILKLYPESLIK